MVPVSRVLRFTDGAGVAFESGSVRRSPGRSSNKHTSIAEQSGPIKLVSATILVRNGTLSNGASKLDIEIIYCARVSRSAVTGLKQDGT